MNYGVDRYSRPAAVSMARRRRARKPTREALPAAAGQRPVAHPAATRGKPARRRSTQRFPDGAAGEPAVLHREERAAAGAVAARDRAHRAQDRAVLLSAAPDPGDERGLGHVLALHAAQPPVRRRPGDDGFMMEFLQSHTNVVFQPPFDSTYYSGINPYALGFAMFTDIRRICEKPDRRRPRLVPATSPAATGTRRSTLRCATSRTRASSRQYLSPKLIRDFRLFAVADDETRERARGRGIHDDTRLPPRARARSSHQYDLERPRARTSRSCNVRPRGDRSLTLRHTRHNGRPLDDAAEEVLKHVRGCGASPFVSNRSTSITGCSKRSSARA